MYSQAFAIDKALSPSGGFASATNVYYWGSTETTSIYAWSLSFANGSQGGQMKVNLYYVRAVRAF